MSPLTSARAQSPRFRLVGLLMLGVLASSSACGERAARSELPALQFARADVVAAQRGAPDLYARAEQARKLALAADDADEQADHAQRARLWLEAAVTEARRIEQARATGAAEARIAAAEAQRVAAERERSELEEAARREAEAQRTRDALVQAFALADSDALGGRARDRKLDAERVRAADVLAARAKLTLAAAVALGLDSKRSEALAAGSAARRTPRSAFERLAAARVALEQAESALGEARAAQPGPSDRERAALIELAALRGLVAQATDRGVVIAIDQVSATGASLATDGKRTSLALADVLRSHLRGPVQLQVGTAAGEAARAAKLKAALAGVAQDRLQVVTAAAGAPLALVLPAYAAAAAPR
jgi:hypothetical protein